MASRGPAPVPTGPAPVPHNTSPASDGVIHDIGFRHYDGPRLGRGWIVRSLMVDTLRGVFGLGRPAKAKVMPWLLLAFFSVFALVTAIMWSVAPLEVYEAPSYAEYPMNLQFLLSLFVASRAPHAISRDLRDGVLPLYLSRPIKRSDYVLARFGGVGLGVFLFILVPQTVLLIGALLAEHPVDTEVLGWGKGIAIGVLVAGLTSAIALAIASTTRRIGMGIAAIMTAFIMLQVVAGILSSTLDRQVGSTPAAYARLIDPFSIVTGIRVSLLGDAGSGYSNVPRGLAGGFACLAILALVVALCLAALMRRYRKVGGV